MKVMCSAVVYLKWQIKFLLELVLSLLCSVRLYSILFYFIPFCSVTFRSGSVAYTMILGERASERAQNYKMFHIPILIFSYYHAYFRAMSVFFRVCKYFTLNSFQRCAIYHCNVEMHLY